MPSRLETLFATSLYRAEIGGKSLNAALAQICLSLAADDKAGQRWARQNAYKGYTSYASLDDLPQRATVFAELVTRIDPQVRAFAKALAFDVPAKRLALDSLWVNVLKPGGAHGAHIHPHSVISGTYYVQVPDGAGAIRFEDPRLGLMMAAPPRKAKAKRSQQTFVTAAPKPGTVLLWESWLRHEVPANGGNAPRISISFNYAVRR